MILKINIEKDSKEVFYSGQGEVSSIHITREKVVELLLPREKRSITEVKRILDLLNKEV
jgi:hypothetical protein